MTADKFQVEWKKFYQAITSKMYDAGKKTPKVLKTKQSQNKNNNRTSYTKGTRKTRSDTTDTPPDEDDILYCDTDDDSNTSLPDPFTPIDPKKVKTLDTKEDQVEDTARQTQEVMDTTDIPELISNEEDPPTKEFTFKKPTGQR